METGCSSFERIEMVLGDRSTRSVDSYRLIRRSEISRNCSAAGYSMIRVSGNGTAAR
jgi:hypothetical protein